ncbi:hypothetical protein EAb13_CDS0042 [Acinetobacter phage EAb13]|nr:hypothetical protein EAb13_CDS0042 [Acinetobacter phage EAb13]
MYKVLRNYIHYMTAWQAENFPTLSTNTPFHIVEHLLYCNGNGCHWLNEETGVDHLIMQMELKLDGLNGWIDFPFCNDETTSVIYTKMNERHHSYYSQHEHFLSGLVKDKALEINPALKEMKLDDPKYWVKVIRENFAQKVAEAQSFKYIWEVTKKRPEQNSLGFPYDFNRPVKPASRKFIPVLKLLDFSKQHDVTHNTELFELTRMINEAVIKVYTNIIDSPEQQEILGEEFIASIRNKLNHFTDFHYQNFAYFDL